VQVFPDRSIAYVLEAGGIEIGDVDWVGCGAWAGIDEAVTLPRLAEDAMRSANSDSNAQARVTDRLRVSAERDAHKREELVAGVLGLGIDRERILFCDHHRSNANVAFFPSPFESAYVLCAGGRGDYRSVTLWRAARATGLTLVDFATELTSPGAFYGFMTEALGFKANRHEGKVTGLAAFGEHTQICDLIGDAFRFDEDSGRMRADIGDYFQPFATATPAKLAQAAATYRKEDLAFAAQAVIERNLGDFFNHHTRDAAPGSIDLCLAGGCMGNVKLNFELSKLPQVRNLYVYPCMGDGGNAVGGAIQVAVEHAHLSHLPVPNVYLGPRFSDDEVAAAFERSGVPVERVNRTEKIERVAAAIAANQVVGWFQGGMEYGPRALGARSILASATDDTVNETLNRRLDRTEFMPFAPVTCAESAAACFIDWSPDDACARTMTTCYDCKPLLAEKCPAVVHVDGTARPQVVFRDDNPDYHDVIERYTALTGVPAIINTSFNHHEEPIVCTPDDAIRCFKRGNIDMLAIEGFIAERRWFLAYRQDSQGPRHSTVLRQ
jgi:carbamoyltransferase